MNGDEKRSVFCSRKVLWPAGIQLLWLEMASLLILFTYLYVSARMMKVITSNLVVSPTECDNNTSSWIICSAHRFTTEARNLPYPQQVQSSGCYGRHAYVSKKQVVLQILSSRKLAVPWFRRPACHCWGRGSLLCHIHMWLTRRFLCLTET